jgi:V/A-type H+/Na+-transporting ATPase subunit G/H
MDDPLKRLLDAEAEAERLVAAADAERQRIIEQARREAGAAEEHHAARVADIHASFLTKAEQRARQTISELQRRSDEQAKALRAAAETREQAALDAAVMLLTGAGTAEP